MKCNTHCAWQVAAEQRNSSQYSTTLRAVAVEHRQSCNSPPDSRRNTKGAISPICISKHVCVCVNVFEKQRNLLQALFSWSLVGFDYTFRKQRTTETGNTGNTHMFANESRALNLPHKTPFTTLNLFMYMETVEPKPVWTKAYVRNKQYIALDFYDSTVYIGIYCIGLNLYSRSGHGRNFEQRTIIKTLKERFNLQKRLVVAPKKDGYTVHTVKFCCAFFVLLCSTHPTVGQHRSALQCRFNNTEVKALKLETPCDTTVAIRSLYQLLLL